MMIVMLCILFLIGLWIFHEGCTNNTISSDPSIALGLLGVVLMAFSLAFLGRFIFLHMQHI